MGSTSVLTFLVPAMMMVFSVVFLVLSRFNISSARWWGLGIGCCAMGFVTPYLDLPIEIATLATDALYLAGFFFYADALLIQFSVPLMRRARLAVSILYLGVNFYVVLVERSLRLELLLSDTVISCVLGYAVLRVMKKAVHPADRVLILMSGLVVTVNMVRDLIFVFLVGSSDNLSDFTTSAYATAMHVTTSVIGLMFIFSVLGSIVMETLARYREDAERDPLTGLYNRRGFDRAVDAAAAAAQHREGVVIVCDIDHFKKVNDSFGHAAGDRVIAELAADIKAGLPPHAIAARFGGEEFIAFIPGASLAEGGVLAQMIRIRFAARDWHSISIDRQITISGGVAVVAKSELSLAEALVRADGSLYAAKAAGRNQIVLDGGYHESRGAEEHVSKIVEIDVAAVSQPRDDEALRWRATS